MARLRTRLRLAIVASACAATLLVPAAAWPADAGEAPAPAVPVEVAAAARMDVPVYLTVLGTVEAFNTVTVRTRVEGELQQVLFKEGQDIKRGDLIAVIDPRTFEAALQQAQAKLQQDQASLQNARLVLDRDTQLGKSDFTSEQTVDNQRSLVAQMEAQVAQDQAMISTAQTQLSYTRIVSPIDGRAGIRLVDQGNIVQPDTSSIVVINQLHPITVLATLPEDQLPAVQAALAAGQVEATAFSRGDGGELDSGTLALIDNQIDPASGTIRLKCTFPNVADRLWPGQFVDLRIRTGTIPNAVTVPSDALQRGPDGYFVYAVGAGDTVEVVAVKAGQIAGGVAVVASGLDAGRRVVVRGQYRLSPGTRISVAADPTKDAAR